MSKTVAVMLADGCEPVEAIAPVDVLRRGGVEVSLVSITGTLEVHAAHGITLVADALLADVALSDFDIVVLPGGSIGVENLGKCAPLLDELTARLGESTTNSKMVGAICAAPMILADLKLLTGRKATCYPSCETNFPQGVYEKDARAIVDGNLITSAGPGTALDFGLALLAALKGEAAANQVAQGMLVAEELRYPSFSGKPEAFYDNRVM